jgi:PAS domain S-box-containing protein
MVDRFPWLDAVIGDTADGLYVVDHQHRIIRWNRGAEQLLGHTADEVLNRHCHEIVRGCARDGRSVCGPDCPVHGCIDRGELPGSMEAQVRTKDGRLIWLHVSLIVIPNEPAPLIVHVLHDVSLGRRAAEAMLQVASLVQASGALAGRDDSGLGDAGSREGPSGHRAETGAFTQREREVLRWLAAGLSNSAIAARMGVSRFTVRSHLQHIMDKAGVHSRSEVVAFAFRHHLL